MTSLVWHSQPTGRTDSEHRVLNRSSVIVPAAAEESTPLKVLGLCLVTDK